MRRPPLRLTVRTMMLAIGVFAVALYLGLLAQRRSADYRHQARFWDHAYRVAVVRARCIESGDLFADRTAEDKQREVDQAKRFAAHAFRLQKQYQRAVFLPLLPLEPDPAPP